MISDRMLLDAAAHTKQHFHKLLYMRLDELLMLTSPRHSVMFALDGPGPLAKVMTQRYSVTGLLFSACDPHDTMLACLRCGFQDGD